MDPLRTTKLNKLFDSVLCGRQLITPQNSLLYLEAICAQTNRPACISKIITSKYGLNAVQVSMHFTLTPIFFNGSAPMLLTYLQAPEIAQIGGGTLLDEIIQKIIDPPIFWTPFYESFRKGLLEKRAQFCFAWLLHYVVAHYTPFSSLYREHASTVLITLLESSDLDVRTLGQKIRHVLESCDIVQVNDNNGPGGRHDNDFANFRDISILPTPDEIKSTASPFLRCSAMLEDLSTESTRLAIHLDNQFRLLREDMLHEMREELQIAFGKKKGHHRGLIMDSLTVEGLHCGSEKKRCKWGITLRCHDDLPQLKKIKDRKRALQDNRNILRHQSLGCLIIDGEIIAFPIINRDEDLLALNPPIIVIQFEGEAATTTALLKLKTAQETKFLQIDTAIFSYVPILKALQQTTTMQIFSELLLWKKDVKDPMWGSNTKGINRIRTGIYSSRQYGCV